MRATTTLLPLLALLPTVLSLATPGEAVYARAPAPDSDGEPTTTSTYVVYVTITQTEEGDSYSTRFVTPTPRPQQFHGNDSVDDDEEGGEDAEHDEYESYPSGTGTWTTVVRGANETGVSSGAVPEQTDDAEGAAAARLVGSVGCMVAVAAAGLMAML